MVLSCTNCRRQGRNSLGPHDSKHKSHRRQYQLLRPQLMTPHKMYTNFLLQQRGKHAVPHSPMEGGVQKVRNVCQYNLTTIIDGRGQRYKGSLQCDARKVG